MEFEQALEVVNGVVSTQVGRRLSDVETILLKGAWHNQTYEQIADASGYSISYLTRDIGPKFWKLLSQALGETVSKTSFQAALERRSYSFEGQRLTEELDRPTSPVTVHCDWGEAIDVSQFYGRQTELSILRDWVLTDRCRLVALLGMGGIGKTSTAAKLAQGLVGLEPSSQSGSQGASFERLIWRSLRNAPPLETLLSELIAFLSNQQDRQPNVGRLLHWLRQSRCLVILDNAETILQAGDYAGRYRPGYEAYGELLRAAGETAHQSCVIVTSREKPADIAALEGIELSVRSMQLSGSPEVAKALIQVKGLSGSDAEQQDLCDRYSCNPLALKIVGTSIQDLFDGEIYPFLEQNAIIFNGIRYLLSQQFDRLSQREQAIMYWLAINREWTSITELAEDIMPSVPRFNLLEALESLSWRSLIEKKSGRYTQQPVVMEYVIDRLIQQIVVELKTGKLSFFAQHALVKTTVKDYVRSSQVRLVLAPIAERLLTSLGVDQLEEQIQQILKVIRLSESAGSEYSAGNLINLCCHLNLDLTGYDFSMLSIRHAYLPGATLHQVNFQNADLRKCVFTQTFSSILSVVFSADDRLLAAGDSNGEIRVWQVIDQQAVFIVKGHTDWVWSIALSPDGELLASGSDDYTIRLWEIATGRLLQTLTGHHHSVRSIAFHPDGTLLASGSHDCTINLWDIASGQVLQTLKGHTQSVRSIAFSPQGDRLVSGSSDQTVKIWDCTSGRCLATLQDHQDQVWSVAWSSEGETIASAGFDKTIKLWDAKTGKRRQSLTEHTHSVLSVKLHPQLKILASSSEDQTIKLWDIETGQCLRTLQEHKDWVWSLAFSHKSLMLASGSDDQTLKLWDVQTGQCLRTLRGHANQVFSVAFHPAGHLLASGSLDGIVRLWDRATGKRVATLQGHLLWVRPTQFSPNGQLLASGSTDETIKLWQVNAVGATSQQAVKTFRGHTGSIRSIAWSPDSRLLASSSKDHTIRLWNVSTGECLQVLQGHTHWVRSIAWSPIADVLASGSDDQTLKLWDVQTGKTLKTLSGHQKWLLAVAWSPNGRWIASGSADQTVRLWDAMTGECVQVLQGHYSQVQSLAFSPDSERLASGGGDYAIRLWQVRTGEVIQVFEGHSNQVQCVAFAPDGQAIASSSNDGTIKLWQVQTAQCEQTLRADRPYEGMDITGATGLTEAEKEGLLSLGALAEQ